MTSSLSTSLFPGLLPSTVPPDPMSPASESPAALAQTAMVAPASAFARLMERSAGTDADPNDAPVGDAAIPSTGLQELPDQGASGNLLPPTRQLAAAAGTVLPARLRSEQIPATEPAQDQPSGNVPQPVPAPGTGRVLPQLDSYRVNHTADSRMSQDTPRLGPTQPLMPSPALAPPQASTGPAAAALQAEPALSPPATVSPEMPLPIVSRNVVRTMDAGVPDVPRAVAAAASLATLVKGQHVERAVAGPADDSAIAQLPGERLPDTRAVQRSGMDGPALTAVNTPLTLVPLPDSAATGTGATQLPSTAGTLALETAGQVVSQLLQQKMANSERQASIGYRGVPHASVGEPTTEPAPVLESAVQRMPPSPTASSNTAPVSATLEAAAATTTTAAPQLGTATAATDTVSAAARPTDAATVPEPGRALTLVLGQRQELGDKLGSLLGSVRSLSDGQLTIALAPKELGRLDVRMSTNADQSLSVTISAQHSGTRDLVEAQIHRLRAALDEQGFDKVQVEVRDQRGDRSGSGQFAGDQGQDARRGQAGSHDSAALLWRGAQPTNASNGQDPDTLQDSGVASGVPALRAGIDAWV